MPTNNNKKNKSLSNNKINQNHITGGGEDRRRRKEKIKKSNNDSMKKKNNIKEMSLQDMNKDLLDNSNKNFDDEDSIHMNNDNDDNPVTNISTNGSSYYSEGDDDDDSDDGFDNNDDEDEEIPEDEAFNSDDEKKYGSFFNNKKGKDYSSGEDDSDISNEGDISDEEEDDDDNGEYMLSLLDKISPSTARKDEENIDNNISTTIIPENEFSTTTTTNTNNKLTLNELMKDISNTTSFGSIQKAMKHLTKDEEENKTKAPLPKIKTERTTRKIHYTNTSKDISLWNTVVYANRDAETLDFTPNNREKLIITTDDWISNNNDDNENAITDFEKEIAQALERKKETSQQNDNDCDDLGNVEINIKDYKKRQGELAKLRALMFYEEQKRHYINKIKSKKYRKIRRKQKERFLSEQEGHEEEDKEEREKEEIERIKERMSLQHKNASKWAKMQLRRGKNIDRQTRQALSAQLQKGEDLLKKMKHTMNQDDNSDDDDDDDKLLSNAKTILQGINDDDKEDLDDQKRSKLFQMDFMKKGLQLQREKAKEEARTLLQDILMDVDNDNQNDDDDGGNNKEESNNKKIKSKDEQSKDKKKSSSLVPKGKLVASSLQHGNSNTVCITGNITVDDFIPLPKQQKSSSNEYTTTFTLSNHDSTKSLQDEKNISTKKVSIVSSKSSSTVDKRNKDDNNPWIDYSSSSTKTENNIVIQQDTTYTYNTKTTINKVEKEDDDTIEKENKSNNDDDPTALINLTQDQLIQKAFAQPNEIEDDDEPDLDPDMIEEFANEKRELQEKNAKRKHDAKSMKGWGSWAGEGISSSPSFKNKKRRKTTTQKTKNQPKQQQKTKQNVIINTKAIKSQKLKHNIVSTIPYPYTSIEEYEYSMLGSTGKEWNVNSGVNNMTAEEIKTKPGVIINPIGMKWKLKKKMNHKNRQNRRKL